MVIDYACDYKKMTKRRRMPNLIQERQNMVPAAAAFFMLLRAFVDYFLYYRIYRINSLNLFYGTHHQDQDQ